MAKIKGMAQDLDSLCTVPSSTEGALGTGQRHAILRNLVLSLVTVLLWAFTFALQLYFGFKFWPFVLGAFILQAFASFCYWMAYRRAAVQSPMRQ